MRTESTTLHAPDGAAIFVHIWRPDDDAAIRGVMVLAHGLAEHAARYDRLAAALTAAGVAVFAPDHRGHGRSCPAAEHGFFAEYDGWRRVLGDLTRTVAHARAAHPGLPMILMGHSMGSSIALSWLIDHSREVDAAILSGQTGVVGPIARVGRRIAQLEALRIGKRGRSKLLNAMAFGAYNKPFKAARTAFEWLSKDPGEVDKYVADPWCGFIASAQLWVDLLGAVIQIQDPRELVKIRRDLPIFAFAGERDPVGGNGAQVRRWLDLMRGLGFAIDSHLWAGGRHEMLNEAERDQVIAEVLQWIERRLPARA